MLGKHFSKGMASTLCYSLYSAVVYSFQQVVDRSLRSCKLNFSNEKVTPLSPAVQKESVEILLSTVANDSATDGVRRVLNISKNVYTCKITADE